jgi:hypothetical protein
MKISAFLRWFNTQAKWTLGPLREALNELRILAHKVGFSCINLFAASES